MNAMRLLYWNPAWEISAVGVTQVKYINLATNEVDICVANISTLQQMRKSPHHLPKDAKSVLRVWLWGSGEQQRHHTLNIHDWRCIGCTCPPKLTLLYFLIVQCPIVPILESELWWNCPGRSLMLHVLQHSWHNLLVRAFQRVSLLSLGWPRPKGAAAIPAAKVHPFS